ncbi:MAG: flagellar biosynthetic protein FliO [Rhodospirillales bacterium]|jgi:flagellar protein FliO/FliZ|nr:flagellar biosynthetic protein FliO [Rhodospirillales bacterium]
MEFEGYFRFFLALVFVLALIGVLAALARRYGLGYRTAPRRGKGRRLSIVEAIPLDAKRRLVLLQRDTTEHLVLLGGGSDLLIESGTAPPPEGGFAGALKNISTEENS